MIAIIFGSEVLVLYYLTFHLKTKLYATKVENILSHRMSLQAFLHHKENKRQTEQSFQRLQQFFFFLIFQILSIAFQQQTSSNIIKNRSIDDVFISTSAVNKIEKINAKFQIQCEITTKFPHKHRQTSNDMGVGKLD